MANLKMSKTSVNVGIDVGKLYLDTYIHEKEGYLRVENTPQGFKSILKRLSYYQVERVVMEATGRHEFGIAEACYLKGLPVVIAKPISVRKYAGAIGQLAKTDKIDAQVIAEYAAIIKPNPTPQKKILDTHTFSYFSNPHLPIDTNHLERALRVISMGRKNYLFCWREMGAEDLGVLQSLMVTCLLHGINPYTFSLRYSGKPWEVLIYGCPIFLFWIATGDQVGAEYANIIEPEIASQYRART